MSIERGDLDWESRVRAAHHRLARTPAYAPEEGEYYSAAWSEAHRALPPHPAGGLRQPRAAGDLRPDVDRQRTGPPLVGAPRSPAGTHVGEHRQLEEAALARDADTAAEVLTRHLTMTGAAFTTTPHECAEDGC